ncbi:MAG: TerB family tellurite resistance protein [Ghiorsea sp.]|nr:TerB family tellurite resistance protein [Ghiorsea sp.]
MIKTLKNWWHQEEIDSGEPELKLAVTKLMVGMMAMDGNVDGVEYSEVIRLLNENYNLSIEESKLLVEEAMDNERNDLHFSKVVAQIEKSFSIEERAQILRKVWLIALADGDVDFMEEQYINRLSGLIGVPPAMLSELKAEQERRYPNLNHSQRYQDPTHI